MSLGQNERTSQSKMAMPQRSICWISASVATWEAFLMSSWHFRTGLYCLYVHRSGMPTEACGRRGIDEGTWGWQIPDIWQFVLRARSHEHTMFVILCQPHNLSERSTYYLLPLYISLVSSNKVRQLAIMQMLEPTCRFAVDGFTDRVQEVGLGWGGCRGGLTVWEVSSGLPLGTWSSSQHRVVHWTEQGNPGLGKIKYL